MPWHPSLNQLRDALADLYPDVADARVVAASALLPLANIPLQGRPRTVWQSILEEAVKQDGVEAVISQVRREYASNPPFLAAVDAYHRSMAGELAPAPVWAATAAANPLALDLGGGVTVALVRVPAGEFLMGSAGTDTQALGNEKPQHSLSLPAYLIAKYPVTVLQFRTFVQAARYPLADPNALVGPDDHPAARMTWYEAMTFCDWASRVSGRFVRLPSEAEWEKAARGADGRIYPWGNRWDAARCNSAEKGPGRTTPVGYYSPLGDSPCECADMAGNVWEWTSSLWGKGVAKPDFQYPYAPQDGRENPDAEDDVRRVLRGGAFDVGAKGVRCAYRLGGSPCHIYGSRGFRVLVAPSD